MRESELSGVPETLLIPLWARAVETRHPRRIIADDEALRLVAAIDYDFGKFKRARLSQLGVAVRTVLLDRATQAFLDRHERACVVNLGAGLDTRHARLRHRDTLWYELDLPEAMALRRRFFERSESYRFLESSVFDSGWMEALQGIERPLLFIAEGLFVYFEEAQLRPLMASLVERFPGASMLLEVQGPGIVGRSRRHDALGRMQAPPEFKWWLSDSRAMEAWHPRLQLVQEWRFFDQHARRAGWLWPLLKLPAFRRRFEPRIALLQFGTG